MTRTVPCTLAASLVLGLAPATAGCGRSDIDDGFGDEGTESGTPATDADDAGMDATLASDATDGSSYGSDGPGNAIDATTTAAADATTTDATTTDATAADATLDGGPSTDATPDAGTLLDATLDGSATDATTDAQPAIDATDSGSLSADASTEARAAVVGCPASSMGASDCGDASDDASCGTLSSGVLDTTFAGTGYVTSLAAPNLFTDDGAYAVIIDPNCRIVSVGSSQNAAGVSGTAAWRVLADGTFDTTFGTAGAWAAPAFAAGTQSAASGVVVLDGGALRVGSSEFNGPVYLTIAGLTPSGALDPAFGDAGVVTRTSSAGGSEDVATSIGADSMGRLLLAGNSEDTEGGWVLAVWRYLPQGSPDPSFGDAGVALLEPSTHNDLPRGAVLDSQDREVVVGDTLDATGRTAAGLWRFTTSGSLDTTFGGTGHVVIPAVIAGENHDNGQGVAIDAQGRIVIAGLSQDATATYHAFAGRLTADGAIDTTFGTGGFTVIDTANGVSTIGLGVATDSVGRVVVAGYAMEPGGDYAAAWRFTGAGALDTTFANGGAFLIRGTAGASPDGGASDVARAVAIDSQNRVLLAGNSAGAFVRATGHNPAYLTLWRLTP